MYFSGNFGFSIMQANQQHAEKIVYGKLDKEQDHEYFHNTRAQNLDIARRVAEGLGLQRTLGCSRNHEAVHELKKLLKEAAGK